jgi:hypothetical protein
MSESPRNLFNALFDFRPREGFSPAENYLSEAFAYALETCDGACDTWLSLALGRKVHAIRFEVLTRNTELDDDNNWIYPDMAIHATLDDGQSILVYSEHKWNSPCDSNQLKKYLNLVTKQGEAAQLAFIGAYRNQKQTAIISDARMKNKVFLWADIYKALNQLPAKSDILVQFLDFMKNNGLDPGKPITPNAMVAYIQSAGFLDSLNHLVLNLKAEFKWEFFPARYRSEANLGTNAKWGRSAIEFATPDWKPTITVGFLYNETDHGVTFVNKQKGIDLLLRIEAIPNDLKNISAAMDELKRKQRDLKEVAASVLLLNERGNGNEHSILIARSCLADVISSATTQEEQAEAVYNTLKAWGEILFDDGLLEKAFKKAGLDSGM